MTDLPPVASTAAGYGLRAWIKQGFKLTKRGGWQWQRTRMRHPARAARLWLVSVGGAAEDAIVGSPNCGQPRRAHWPQEQTMQSEKLPL